MINITSPKFHQIVKNEVEKIGYGTITFTFIVKKGIPLIQTLNISRQKRIKYDNGQRI
jgi:flagellar biosynthesis/type III secretory pathway chaperone